MVSLAKKKDVKVKTEQPLVTSSTSSKDQGRQAEAAAGLSVSSVTDEQKITKQLEEYQRALYKSSQKSEIGQYNPGQSMAAKLLESQTQNSPEQPLKVDVASRKSCEDSGSSESPRGEVSSVLENLRRRASRDGFSVVESRESPPEKRSRRAAVTQGVPVTPSTSPQPTSSGSGRSKSSGKGKILQIMARRDSAGIFSLVRFFTHKQFIVKWEEIMAPAKKLSFWLMLA